MASFEPLQRRLLDARTLQPAIGVSSSTMSVLLDLDSMNLETVLAYSILRALDCLACHWAYFTEMDRADKKLYRELANQELGIAVWFHGLVFTRHAEGSQSRQYYSEIRSWMKSCILEAIPEEERPPPGTPFKGPLPLSGHPFAWWRDPEDRDVSSTPSLVYDAWQVWAEVLD
ncbi:hypothetical protein BKA70DRAFT_1233765 [Coprinopsis sp. MPI-PUGE-AT-0042]|nr:hypothetical protein BKA70DRAFT_1233765 [Coprinopsis sp. MPI-PUGE-AT-0042]